MKEWNQNEKDLTLYNKECQVGELKEKCLEGFNIYQKQVRVKRMLHTTFDKDKFDPNSKLLQVDFAMAYSCEYTNEIQWLQRSVNPFTAAT